MQEELFSFKGRMNRLKYWLYSIVPIAIMFIAAMPIILTAQEGREASPFFSLLMFVAIVIAVWISLAIQVKRWHDIDQSGWWVLAGMIPYVNIIVLIVLGFVKGTEGTNRFGEDPLVNNAQNNTNHQYVGQVEQRTVAIAKNKPPQHKESTVTLLGMGGRTPPIVLSPNREITVGRSSNVSVKIDNKYVSNKHLVLTLTDGKIKVRDLASSNGTYIDGKKLEPNIPYVLNEGERLIVGSEDVIYTL